MDEEFGPAAMAIFVGDVAELQRLLTAEPGLATRRSSVGHPTLLQLVACEAGNIDNSVEAASLLVASGASTAEPIVAAAGCSSQSILEFFLDHGVDVDGEALWTPLDEALYWNNQDIARLLLARGAKVRALSTAAGLGDVALIESFFDADGGLRGGAGPIASPFPATVAEAVANDSQSLLDHAFVMGVNAGQRTAAELLLSRGAQVNARPPGFHWLGTALHAACWRGDRDLVEWLLSEGADPSIHDGLANSDAHGWAEHHGHGELAKFLRDAATGDDAE